MILFYVDSESIVNRKLFDKEISEICSDLKANYIAVIFNQENSISVLSYQSLEIKHKFIGHSNRLISINFDLKFEKLISLGTDKTVRVW